MGRWPGWAGWAGWSDEPRLTAACALQQQSSIELEVLKMQQNMDRKQNQVGTRVGSSNVDIGELDSKN